MQQTISLPASLPNLPTGLPGSHLMEMFEDAVAWFGGYDPKAERAQQKMVSTLILFASVGITAGSAAVLLWKRGLIQPLLPEGVLKIANQYAHKIAELTEPPQATRLDKASMHHLTRVYSTAARLFGYSFLGVYAFFKMPYLPLPLTVAGSLVPAGILYMLPREHVNPRSRQMLVNFSAFCVGYTMGPVNWIALDLTIHGGVSVLATAVGFSATSYMTRGKISYFLFSQVLSSALAVIGSNAVVKSSLGYAQSTPRAQQSVNCANVNTVLTIQLVSNIVLAALHSLPTMVRLEQRSKRHEAFKQEKGIPLDEEITLPDDEAKFGTTDVEREAYTLFAIAGYTTWTLFRYAWTACVMKTFGKNADKHGSRPANRGEEMLREGAVMHHRLSKVSDIAASVTFFFFYIRAVGYMQSTATVNPTLDRARYFFAHVSPFVLVA